ncbi:ead/Ea22-like family protein [Escherichia coli]|uniref:ead/Ea22-like family protein n=1 Tax=Escherichia coli TaxID=562 RepID=UPI000DA531BE|nr:ead/Ea22-like family protein [Escherichia coli]SQQ48058.1 EA22-like protein; similarities with EA22 from lambda (modular protein involved in blocking host replication) [Escherichia coli]
MSKIDYQELREAAEQATQDEWVAYILPGHNGIYPARTSEGRHCGYFIDWPGVCQGRESISIRTYAVNCNDAWLNTEGDDISGSYVKYKDHQEVVAALEAKCAALAAENAALKQSEKEFNNFCRQEYYGWEDNFTETPATDAFLAEVRAVAFDELRAAFVRHVKVAGLDEADTVTLKEVTEALLHCAEQIRAPE